jgi:hypothetical protein
MFLNVLITDVFIIKLTTFDDVEMNINCALAVRIHIYIYIYIYITEAWWILSRKIRCNKLLIYKLLPAGVNTVNVAVEQC